MLAMWHATSGKRRVEMPNNREHAKVASTDFLALCIATYQLLLPVVGIIVGSVVVMYLVIMLIL